MTFRPYSHPRSVLRTRLCPRWLKGSALAVLFLAKLLISTPTSAQEQACPDLQTYYPGIDPDWRRLVEQLVVLQPRCLESAEYYALLGAAEMNSGFLDAALEALERALLLQPNHGAAAVDYAQALYLSGQEFAAIELNTQLLARDDLPPALGNALQQRQDLWQQRIRAQGFTLEAALGYDDNLNGAPSRSEFTLTLAGGIIEVPLDESFRPVSGPYVNFRLGGYYRRRSAEREHDFTYGIRNRQSEFAEAELLQSDIRYALGIPLRHYRWDLSAGTTNLLYGGSPLFTATDFRARLRQQGEGCRPVAELAAQHQLYHQQSFMAGMELGLTGGVECRLSDRNASASFETGLVENRALKDRRPGGDRDGWIVRAGWQQAVGRGLLRAQYSLATLEDASGYSELLQEGAVRRIFSRQFRVQYLRPIQQNLTLQLNLSHQRQSSNLAPFANRGTAVDLGVNLAF